MQPPHCNVAVDVIVWCGPKGEKIERGVVVESFFSYIRGKKRHELIAWYKWRVATTASGCDPESTK